jgi:hypothetical protein
MIVLHGGTTYLAAHAPVRFDKLPDQTYLMKVVVGDMK